MQLNYSHKREVYILIYFFLRNKKFIFAILINDIVFEKSFFLIFIIYLI